MTMARIVIVASGALLVACSSPDEGVGRAIRPSIILQNASATTPPPPGPFVSVIDSVELRVTTDDGSVVARLGQRIAGYRTTATMQPSFPPGNTTFTADVFSKSRAVIFTGSMTQLITSDVASLPLTIRATRPVLLMVPDTAVTNTVTSTQFAVYNAGLGSLDWSLIATDTAFTRCGTQCTISPTSGTVAPGATTMMRVTVPTNFPSRRFSFNIRSAEGNVTTFWAYSSSAISSVAVQPTASLHNIGQAFPLTASVQASGTASQAVTWSSSTPAVATVNGTGVVTGVQARVATVTATSSVDTAKKASADIRVYDSTAVNSGWAITAPAAPDTIRRDDTSPGARSTVVLRAQLSGSAAPYASVEFWVRPGASGPWRRVGQSGAGVETGGVWSWSYTWNPDATDAPFINPSTVGLSVLAIGINSSGQVVATAPNANVFVRVP